MRSICGTFGGSLRRAPPAQHLGSMAPKRKASAAAAPSKKAKEAAEEAHPPAGSVIIESCRS